MPFVIIDVQESYPVVKKCPELVRNIVKHTKKAIEREAPIIVLEYQGWDDTHESIRDILREYDNFNTYIKNKSDGSQFVIKYLKNIKFPIPGAIQLCGIMTNDCVAATARGLHKEGFKVRVIEEACASTCSAHNNQIDSWEEDRIIKVTYKAEDYRWKY